MKRAKLAVNKRAKKSTAKKKPQILIDQPDLKDTLVKKESVKKLAKNPVKKSSQETPSKTQPIQKKLEFKFPKISFNPLKILRIWIFNFQNYFLQSQTVRVISAILLTVLVVGGFVYFSRNDSLSFVKKADTEVSTNSLLESPEFQRNLDKLRNISNTLNPENIVYDRIKYQDLPVYPQGWVERNFSATELRNSLVSGPSADPDGDDLSNKAEFLYGSDPKNKYSLCGTYTEEAKCQKTDKENVDLRISPLTGLEIEENKDILVSKQDQVFLKSVEESFEASSKEGVDFPVLYQESKLIDLSDELEDDSFAVVPDSRVSFKDYIDKRVDIVDGLLTEDESSDELGSLLNVYKTSKVEDLKKIYNKYDQIHDTLLKAGVPETYKESHKPFLMLFRKLKILVQHRQNGFENQTTETQEYLTKSKKLAVEVVWSYRQMDEELRKLSND
jgi:hypothetical protein